MTNFLIKDTFFFIAILDGFFFAFTVEIIKSIVKKKQTLAFYMLHTQSDKKRIFLLEVGLA
jgi:hypothetical protein